MSLDKTLARAVKWLLAATIVVPPFIVSYSLYFPFVSGKAYFFRLLVEISFALWLFLAIRSREYWPNFRNPVLAATFIFLIGLVVTALLGVDPVNSLFSNTERADGVIQFAHWVLYLVMITSIFKSKEDWRQLLKIFVALAAALAVYAWFKDWISPALSHVPRLQGSFGNSSYLGAFILFAIGAAGLLAVPRRENPNSKSWIGWIALAVFFTLTLVFTQTRGAYLGFGAGFILLVSVAFLFLRTRHKRLAIGLGASLFGGIAIIALIFASQQSQFVQTHSVVKRIAELPSITESASFSERISAWRVAVKTFRDRPLFGWGPENYGAAFNFHYDFHATQLESWFDRPHNQPLQILAEGGVFLFSLYLLWISAVLYAISRIFKKRKLTGGILASTYLAFLAQDLLLFDTYPLYLGLFPFLGFIYFAYESGRDETREAAKHLPTRFYKTLGERSPSSYIALSALIAAALLTSFYTVWLPYKGNSLVVRFYDQLKAGEYGKAEIALGQSATIESPYTWFDSRKNSGWVFVAFLEAIEGDKSKLDETNYEPILELYRSVTARLEEALAYRPLDQQIYFVLGKTYRLGAEALGQTNDLAKGEAVLQKGREIALDRAEYVNELAKIFINQGRFEEAETLMKEHQARVKPDPQLAHVTLGHLYFLGRKYDLAMSEYDEAKKLNYRFWESDQEYNRYLFTSDQVGEYEKIVEVSKEYLDNRGPDGDIWFNLSLAHQKLGQREEAVNAFKEAVKLKPEEYAQYQQFFGVSP